MALENLFKLQKLKIHSYSEVSRKGDPPDTFTAMFNPTSLSFRHENIYSNRPGINTGSPRANFSYSRPKVIQLDLVLDGTGVTDYGLATLIGQGAGSVAEQIEHFRKLCDDTNAGNQPKFLKIQWGEGLLRNFDCRLRALDIEYTAYDRDASPLRATLKTTFVEDAPADTQQSTNEKSSPDLLHTRTIKSGDTLPLLTKAIYGSSHYYLRVAQVNNLDDFRNLTPGQELIFPPLEKRATRV
jgi:hypothetical protein